MTHSILEITEKQYLIKLKRNNFNLSLIRSWLKMAEVANASDDHTSTPDTHFAPSQNHFSEPGNFSPIEEK